MGTAVFWKAGPSITLQVLGYGEVRLETAVEGIVTGLRQVATDGLKGLRVEVVYIDHRSVCLLMDILQQVYLLSPFKKYIETESY